MRRGTEAVLLVGLVALDQGVKALTAGKTAVLIPGVIGIHAVENHGFSLGLFSDAGLVAAVLSVALFLCLALVNARLAPDSRLRFPLMLMCAGALGNVIDRVILGYVRDMIELLFIRFYIFNVADMCVTVGAALAAIVILFPGKRRAL